MCGLAGIMRLEGSSAELDPSLIGRMTDTLAHRGPDDRGCWQDGGVALGSRRLAVIDLSSAGRQPMSNEDGTIHLAYNGEVYNFRELAEEYRLSERHRFRSRTDTEVLLHLYEELGTDLFARLYGMFALAIWDGRERRMILGRDRCGIKPLFYQIDGDFLRFGSEIKAILTDSRVVRKPSLQALHDFLTFDYVPGRQTAFEGILEVPHGHFMSFGPDGSACTQRFWQLCFDTDDSIDESFAVRRASELIDRAVERRLIADVPIGVLLSGGLDSSTILARMHGQTSEPIHTYSVGFEDRSFNELPYARLAARHFDTVHREVVVTPQTVSDLLPEYLKFIDEPYGDGSAIPTYCVCELAKDEVVVVLSGEGGDEAFAGYDTYAALRASQWYRRVPGVARQLVVPLVNALPVSHKKLSLEFRLKRFVAGQELDIPRAHLWWRMVFSEEMKRSLYSSEVSRGFEPLPSERHFLRLYDEAPTSDPLNRLLYIDSQLFLPDDLMIKNDRMSMAHSLEARVPFTDHELTEFMGRVPPRLKMRGLQRKRILREAVRHELPAKLLKKKKVGLEMPYSRWLREDLRPLLLETLGPRRLGQIGLFDIPVIKRLVDEHIEGRYDHGRALWGLVNYVMWFELYID